MEFIGWRVQMEGREVGFWSEDNADRMLESIRALLPELAGAIRIMAEFVKEESE